MSRFALVCIDTLTMHVRRYVRNSYGKLWVTHEAKIHSVCVGIEWQLNNFRLQPNEFELFTGEPEAA